jgi:hypothetical protein
MVELPKVNFTGFTSILAGFIFFATGILLFYNTSNTPAETVSLGVLRILGVVTALVGLLLLVSRDE